MNYSDLNALVFITQRDTYAFWMIDPADKRLVRHIGYTDRGGTHRLLCGGRYGTPGWTLSDGASFCAQRDQICSVCYRIALRQTTPLIMRAHVTEATP